LSRSQALSAPGVVPATVKAEDAQDQREREEQLGAGHGTKNTGFVLAFWKTLASQAEPGSAKQGKQEANDGGEDSRLLLPARPGIEHALLVQAEGLGGNDWTQATPTPGGNGRARDLDVLDDGLAAAANDVLAKAMVIGAASSGRG
jgi:hypothetical protein